MEPRNENKLLNPWPCPPAFLMWGGDAIWARAHQLKTRFFRTKVCEHHVHKPYKWIICILCLDHRVRPQSIIKQGKLRQKPFIIILSKPQKLNIYNFDSGVVFFLYAFYLVFFPPFSDNLIWHVSCDIYVIKARGIWKTQSSKVLPLRSYSENINWHLKDSDLPLVPIKKGSEGRFN